MAHPICRLAAACATAALLAVAGVAATAGAQTPPASRPHFGVTAVVSGRHDVMLATFGSPLPAGGPYAVVEQTTSGGITSTVVSGAAGDSQPTMNCLGSDTCLLAIRNMATGKTVAFDRVHLPVKVPPMGKSPAPYRATGPERVSLSATLTWAPAGAAPGLFPFQELLAGGQAVPGKMYADFGAIWGPEPLTASDTLIVYHGTQVLGYWPGQDAEANVVGGSPGRWSEQLLAPDGKQLAVASVVIPRLHTPAAGGQVVPPAGKAGVIDVSGSVTYHVADSGRVSATIDPSWRDSSVDATFPAGTTLTLFHDDKPVWSRPASTFGGAADAPIVVRQAGVWALGWYAGGRAVSETLAVVPEVVGR